MLWRGLERASGREGAELMTDGRVIQCRFYSLSRRRSAIISLTRSALMPSWYSRESG